MTGAELIKNAFAFAFLVLILFAVIGDVRHLIIRNWISAALVVMFLLYLALADPSLPIGWHLLSAFIVFAVGFGLFIMGWVAGGDVKFMAALALWAGPDLILPFAQITTILGALLAATVLAAHWLDSYGEAVGMPSGARRFMPRWARRKLCPYGLAIGLAALIIVPARFF